MTIEDLYNYFKTSKKPKFYLVDVFSWRGIYNEVAFKPSKKGSVEESIEILDRAISETFYGHKGGEYTYNLYTEAHFELEERGSSDMALYNLLLDD